MQTHSTPPTTHSAPYTATNETTTGEDSVQSHSIRTPTHPVVVGYLFWILGFVGAHRFYFGKPITGAIWFFTGGVFLIGWIVDLFLIPAMADEANRRYRSGQIDYTLAWVLHLFLGLFGVHRFYMGKLFSGVIYLLTGGLLGIGYAYDTLTLNEQIEEINFEPIAVPSDASN